SPCPVEVMKRVNTQMHMTEVEICYGMTETSPVSFQTLPDDDEERRVGTVGTVHPHVEAKVVESATGAVVPRGTPGELLTRGYPVMLGYWGNEEATREAGFERGPCGSRTGISPGRRPPAGRDFPPVARPGP